MIASPALVYKSNTPAEHHAIIEANHAHRARIIEQMEALATSLVPGSEPWGFTDVTGRTFMQGLLLHDRSLLPDGVPPAGMRWDTKVSRARTGGGHVLVPALKTPEGKAIAEKIKPLDYRPRSLGATSKILTVTDGVNTYWGSAVYEVIEHDSHRDVYATYRRALVDDPRDKGIVDADPTWTETPLSQFWAAREKAMLPTAEMASV